MCSEKRKTTSFLQLACPIGISLSNSLHPKYVFVFQTIKIITKYLCASIKNITLSIRQLKLQYEG